MEYKETVKKVIAEVCRLLLGVVFIFSGTVKAVDPMGGAIKIGDYLMQLVVAVTVFCALFRRMMEQVGFPPKEHWLKYATWLVLYIVTLYGTGWFFTQIAGKIVLLRLLILSYSIFCLLLGAGLYAIHFWRYGKDPRLSARI